MGKKSSFYYVMFQSCVWFLYATIEQSHWSKALKYIGVQCCMVLLGMHEKQSRQIIINCYKCLEIKKK